MPYTPNNPYIPGDPYSYDLKWIVEKLKEAISLYQPLNDKFDNLYDYVHDYFDNLDLTSEVRSIIDQMESDGYFDVLVTNIVTDSGTIENTVTQWLTDHVDPVGSAVTLDDTLTIQGSAADAKAVGDRFAEISELSGNIFDGVTASGYYIANDGSIAIAGTPAFCTPDFIAVDPSTQYYLLFPYYSCRIAEYDSSENFIGFLGYFQNDFFTTSATAAYIRFWSGYGNDYPGGLSIKKASDTYYNIYTPYRTAVDYIARANDTNKYIIIGPTGDYSSVVDGFNAAIAANTGVIFQPGTYDMTLYYMGGSGPTAPKHIIGYGAKLTAYVTPDNWSYSPVNISPSMPEVIIEGLEIDVSGCRYCIHDEMFSATAPYHHVFKNLKLTHQSYANSTLIRPICIGGGNGEIGTVEIYNCITSSHDANNQDINYHAKSSSHTGSCKVFIHDCYLGLNAGISGNAQTGFVDYMYKSNCSCGGNVAPPGTANAELIAWNNVIR